MQVRHQRTVISAQSGIARIAAIACSANNKRLAIADHARSIQLYDESGERRDRFVLKSGDGKEQKTFVVRGMAFSPDSTRLAVAQSDAIVFVYKLGLEWGERKSICNKFPQPTAVTCLCWPNAQVGGSEVIAFGTAEGKVKVALIRSNKAQTLFSHDRAVVSICSNADGTQVISGHEDGSLMRFSLEGDESQGATRLCTHTCAPYVLGWGEHVVAGGNDCRVTFYDKMGHAKEVFDYPVTDDKELTCGSFNPSGHALAVGSWNKVRMFNFSIRSKKWEEGAVLSLPNSLEISALTWKADGSRIFSGTLCGAVDTFDACLKKYRVRGAFEFTYVAHNQVIVKRLSTGTRIVLKSHLGFEILKVHVHKDRFLVAHTATTLLIGDLGTCKLSEVQWHLSGKEQFYFDNPQVCMVFVAGELCLIEYGRNEVLGTCRTDNVNTHRISVRIHEPSEAAIASGVETAGAVRKAIAYLIDRQTVQVDDLISGMATARIAHPFKVDWLELNHRASKLLFRDKQRQLFIYDIATQTKSTLLNFCTYVQWVPDSDVVVAQNRSDLCVWYTIDAPDKVAVVPIKGEVQGIERTAGKTEVVVDEGVSTVAYGLDEHLIEFGSAMEERDYDRACDLLDQITLSNETESMWENLATVALGDMRLHIAERCYAALGNVSRAQALHHISELVAQNSSPGSNNGIDHFSVRAELALLSKDFKRAEAIYLDNARVEKAMEMYDELFRFEDAIAVAESRGHKEAGTKRSHYYDWLMSTRQEEKAGELREKEGKYIEAINLYLKGGVPARAAHVVSTYNVRPEQQLLEAIASALFKAQVFEKAGDLFEKLKMDERAIDAYKRGHVFRRAVDLARRAFPAQVVTLEDGWGDWLVSQKQVDQAINHYIEAHQYGKAIEAAISSRQWGKAVNIVEQQNLGGPNDPVVQRYYKQIATYFEQQQQLAEAEKYYLKGNAIYEAVDMYSRRGLTDHMMRVGTKLPPAELTQLFVQQAKQYESKGDLAAAERIFLKINEVDQAIVMYKKARDFNNMIRLVQQFRPEFVTKTHLNLGAQFEKEGNFKTAEQHFVTGKDWNRAVNMYRDNNLWDDAVRVAKVHGGAAAGKQVVLTRAMVVDSEEGVRLLTKFNLLEAGIEAALEAQKFDIALNWAQLALPSKLPVVFLKNAMYWEDQGEFRMAEDAFIKAGKPREAIDMYIHQQEFGNGMRIAESYDPAAIPMVCTAHGKSAFTQGNFKEAEALLLRANAPEVLLKLYMDARMLTDAQRIAKEYCPDRSANIAKVIAYNTPDPLQAAHMLEENGEYQDAIEQYLRVGREHSADFNQVVTSWQRAVRLAQQHARGMLKDTAKQVVQKMVEAGRHDEAAKILEDIEDYKGAINVYVNGGKFEQAEALAQRISPELVELVKRARVQAAIDRGSNSNGRDELESIDKDAALKAHIGSGDWEKAMRLARQMGAEQTRLYAAMYVQALLKENNVAKALDVIARDGIETGDLRFFKTFTQLASQAILALPSDALDVGVLHDGLYQILANMNRMGQSSEDIARTEGVLSVLHVYATAASLRRNEMNEAAARLMYTLPRFVHVMPADKAYYDAGVAARDYGNNMSIAFMFLNRLLDILDKIEDGETNAELDNFDFASTDFPASFPLPEQTSLDKRIQDEARQWVLAKSLDPKFEQTLPTFQHPTTGEPVFIAAVRSPSGQQFDTCAVTGGPVMPTSRVTCTSCKRPANVEDWNKFVVALKSCPWCKAQQSVAFKV